ncbi:AAA family ATPase [Paenibacillus lautus]|uniref:AAA family ATPase n=1 Tax=Paenibacillus lautus TaxID=1401 RepID=UPI002DB7B62C|nr:AAA family ATPase [Paenibacillus lautus]MEC0206928.1 AAA family ATPase [Paenibacillus lautus]
MIISFIGPPGCGKSTQIEFVTKTFLQDVDVIMLRVPNLVKKLPTIVPYLKEEEVRIIDELTQASYECRDNGRLSPIELDHILFEVAERCVEDKKYVVLDGAPRGLEQAKFFCNRRRLKDETIVVHLAFHQQAFENSVSRQFYREALSNGFETATNKIQRFCNKFETYNTDTIQGFQLLKSHQIPFVEIDALLPKMDVSQQLERLLTKQLIMRLSHK